MLCKSIFINYGRVKGFLKVILQYKSVAPELKKWAWHVHNEIVAINPKFQVSVQILCTVKVNKQEKNKCLKFKKGVGITIKNKESSCKLGIYTLQTALATICVCSCKHKSSWLASDIHTCTNETHSIANLQDLIPTLAS